MNGDATPHRVCPLHDDMKDRVTDIDTRLRQLETNGLHKMEHDIITELAALRLSLTKELGALEARTKSAHHRLDDQRSDLETYTGWGERKLGEAQLGWEKNLAKLDQTWQSKFQSVRRTQWVFIAIASAMLGGQVAVLVGLVQLIGTLTQ